MPFERRFVVVETLVHHAWKSAGKRKRCACGTPLRRCLSWQGNDKGNVEVLVGYPFVNKECYPEFPSFMAIAERRDSRFSVF